jgi:Ca2+-transporting ATPase
MPPINVKQIKGLSEEQASAARKIYGFNELPSSKKRGIFTIAFGVIREPMFILLVFCGVIYLFTGDREEALMLLGFVFFVMGITFYQERKTERALESLRDLSSPRALVIRDGVHRRIAGREVVPGDYVILAEGDRVPADGVIIWNNNLCCDESLLTGESVPVVKSGTGIVEKMGRPGGEGQPFVFSSTVAVAGQAVYVVRATGNSTETGKIGKALAVEETKATFLQNEINSLVRYVGVIGAVLCVLVFVLYGLNRGDFLNGFLAGLSLAMAILPEEFPLVLTVFFALGAWRISKKKVLTRRVPVIETLGSATVLCVDKTGTLTMNLMSVRKIFVNGKYFDIDTGSGRKLAPEVDEITEYGIMSCQKDPFDPMEKAFMQLGDYYASNKPRIYDTWNFVREYPLSEKMLALSHVFKAPEGGGCVIACKGAPESIADICHFSAAETTGLMDTVSEMAHEGYRVIGVAKAVFGSNELPDSQHDFKFEFIGLVGLADPIRPGVKEAIKECCDAGVRVVMITGDYPGTAKNVAAQIGLMNKDAVLTGAQLEDMDEATLRKKVGEINIFARMVPEQKLKLVNALKANGEITAMTGDGVNDAPALKAADIGIAMGGRGTDVARESAALVLLDDAFESIVSAVKLGRRIFDNIKKALSYIVAVHVPIAGLSLIPVVMKWPLILMPVHIVFLELIIDPACSIVFEAEPEEKDVMKRPPRKHGAKVFGKGPLLLSLLQGFIVLGVILGVFLLSGQFKASEEERRAIVFATLVVSNLCLILTNLSWSRNIIDIIKDPNPAMWWVIGGALLVLGVVFCSPFLRELFRFGPLSLMDVVMCFGAGFTSIMWFEAVKLLNRKWKKF